MTGILTSGTLTCTPCAIKLWCNLAQLTLIDDSVKIALYSRSSGTKNRESEPEAKGKELICGPVHCKASVPVPPLLLLVSSWPLLQWKAHVLQALQVMCLKEMTSFTFCSSRVVFFCMKFFSDLLCSKYSLWCNVIRTSTSKRSFYWMKLHKTQWSCSWNSDLKLKLPIVQLFPVRSLAGLHVLGNFWKLGKFFQNLGTFCFWANVSKNWAKMNIFWANFFSHTFTLVNKFVQFTARKNAVLHHLKFLRKFYPKKIFPIHAVQPLPNFQEKYFWWWCCQLSRTFDETEVNDDSLFLTILRQVTMTLAASFVYPAY